MPHFRGNRYHSTPWRVRFWAKVRKTPTCWLWQGTTKKGRRPHEARAIFKDNGYPYYAARFLWTKLRGPIPKNRQVLHTCDNPLCVRLSHLWLGTQIANMDDMKSKGRARTIYHYQREGIDRAPSYT